MKSMSCKQLGGACEKVFYADTFEDMAALSKQHGIDMFKKHDAAHLKAMQEMQKLMEKPELMHEWFEAKKKEFEELPED